MRSGVEPGQHRVLGGDPAAALAAQPRRHARLDRRGAQHAGAAELDQHRPRRELGEVARERDRTKVGGLAPVRDPRASRSTRRTRWGAARVTDSPNASEPSATARRRVEPGHRCVSIETVRAGFARRDAGLLRGEVVVGAFSSCR